MLSLLLLFLEITRLPLLALSITREITSSDFWLDSHNASSSGSNRARPCPGDEKLGGFVTVSCSPPRESLDGYARRVMRNCRVFGMAVRTSAVETLYLRVADGAGGPPWDRFQETGLACPSPPWMAL